MTADEADLERLERRMREIVTRRTSDFTAWRRAIDEIREAFRPYLRPTIAELRASIRRHERAIARSRKRLEREPGRGGYLAGFAEGLRPPPREEGPTP